MPGNAIRVIRSGVVGISFIVAPVLSGCVRARDVTAPGLGHPANPVSASVVFVPPENLLAGPSAPADDARSARPGMEMPGKSGTDHDHPADPGLAVYTCPMHADVRSDRPGTCPKCGMQLVPSHTPDQSHQHGGMP